jgi:hypothetical protein
MAAKNVSKAVKAAVSPFEELGSKIGKLGMSLPKYAPILPGGLSISGANKLADRAVSIPDEITSKKTKESKLGTMLGMNGQADTVALKKAHDYIKNDHDALNEYSTRHKEILSELMKNGDKYIEKEGAYKEYMEKMSDKYKDASQITIQ